MQQFKIQDAQGCLEDLIESALEGKEILIVIVEQIPIVSADPAFNAYPIERLW